MAERAVICRECGGTAEFVIEYGFSGIGACGRHLLRVMRFATEDNRASARRVCTLQAYENGALDPVA